jgi:hypothetical protein
VREGRHTDTNAFRSATINDQIAQHIARVPTNDLRRQEFKGWVGLLEIELFSQSHVFDLSLAQAHILNDELIDEHLQVFILCPAGLQIGEEVTGVGDPTCQRRKSLLHGHSNQAHSILHGLQAVGSVEEQAKHR